MPLSTQKQQIWMVDYLVDHPTKTQATFTYLLNVSISPTQTLIVERINDSLSWRIFNQQLSTLGIYGSLLHGLVVTPKNPLFFVSTVQQQQRMSMKSEPLPLPANGQLSSLSKCCASLNSLTAKSCYGGEKHLNPVGFYSRNSTESTLQHKHNNHKHHHHSGAVCPSYGVGPMDTPDPTQETSLEVVGQECFGLILYKRKK